MKNQIVEIKGQELVTDSLTVADKFGKRHDHVIRDIEHIIKENDNKGCLKFGVIKALFLLEQKFKNLRDVLDLNQLATVTTADAIVAKAIKEGMTSRLNYKDIYQLAKSRVETLAELRGKTLIPATQQIGYQRAIAL